MNSKSPPPTQRVYLLATRARASSLPRWQVFVRTLFGLESARARAPRWSGPEIWILKGRLGLLLRNYYFRETRAADVSVFLGSLGLRHHSRTMVKQKDPLLNYVYHVKYTTLKLYTLCGQNFNRVCIYDVYEIVVLQGVYAWTLYAR